MDITMPGTGDWGAVITFTMRRMDDTVLDISTATSLKGWMTKPDGTVPDALTGTMVGDGSAGQFTVTIAEGTLDISGEYRVEPEVVFPTAAFVGTVFKFTVRPSARS